MRRLMLLRHAKSDWPQGVGDHERPLAKRGREAAPLMGAYMAREHLLPDLVLVSTAQRTQETWQHIANYLPEDVEVRDEARIYNARPEALLDLVRQTPDKVRTLLMIGHNPGFEDVAARLTGHGDRYAYSRMSQKFPTAALAVLDFAAEHWGEVSSKEGRLDRFVTPRMLGGEDE